MNFASKWNRQTITSQIKLMSFYFFFPFLVPLPFLFPEATAIMNMSCSFSSQHITVQKSPWPLVTAQILLCTSSGSALFPVVWGFFVFYCWSFKQFSCCFFFLSFLKFLAWHFFRDFFFCQSLMNFKYDSPFYWKVGWPFFYSLPPTNIVIKYTSFLFTEIILPFH